MNAVCLVQVQRIYLLRLARIRSLFDPLCPYSGSHSLSCPPTPSFRISLPHPVEPHLSFLCSNTSIVSYKDPKCHSFMAICFPLSFTMAMLARLKQVFSHEHESEDESHPVSFLGCRKREKAPIRSRRTDDFQNRKRSISIDRAGRRRRTKDQLQSSFFAKLPIELRLKIYEMVLSKTGQVHIIVGSDGTSLYGRTCRVPGRMCPQPSNCIVQGNMLLTCRRM